MTDSPYRSFKSDPPPEDGKPILALDNDDSEWPVAVQWNKYDAENAEELGEEGYWNYCDPLLADTVMEIHPKWWMPTPIAPTTVIRKDVKTTTLTQAEHDAFGVTVDSSRNPTPTKSIKPSGNLFVRKLEICPCLRTPYEPSRPGTRSL